MLIRVTKYKSNYNTLEKDISSVIIIDLENPAKRNFGATYTGWIVKSLSDKLAEISNKEPEEKIYEGITLI